MLQWFQPFACYHSTTTILPPEVHLNKLYNTNSIQSNSFEEKTQSLTHVIMNFADKQLSTMIVNMDSWNRYFPCKKNNKNTNIELIFHISVNERTTTTQCKEMEQKIIKSFENRPYKTCFSNFSISFLTVRMNEDTHTHGARLQFENILNKNVFISSTLQPQYILLMEVDLYPMREGWLDILQYRTLRSDPFWVKGSIYLGEKIYPATPRNVRYHINACAIYNVNDMEFTTFYFDVVRKWIQKKYGNIMNNGYDLDFNEYLNDDNEWPSARNVKHKFIYTDLIQNQYYSPWNATLFREKFKNLVLVHGRYPINLK